MLPRPRPAVLLILQLRLVVQVKAAPLGENHPLQVTAMSRVDGMVTLFLFNFYNMHHASWRH